MKKTRCFLALLPEAQLQRQLFDCADQLRARLPAREIRWSDAAQWHLTTAFLGNLSDEQIRSLCAAMPGRLRHCGPVSSRIRRVAQFPNPGKPKVIAALADLSPSLAAVRAQSYLPGEQAERRYSPHITLGRYRRTPHPSPFNPLPVDWQFEASELLLIASQLTPAGAVYTGLAAFPLSA
ncbi:RNA 2',3'-cyclic phosphodiesterase [Granulosicoccaceae sp. 1_MG-2023]|nr:RNA 2',3'-cyclic phosphodiesterase [Granulosicoccaceae sp. 1_MG-2023]